MFVGHYGAALALKGVERDAPLGWLFIAVQFVDVLFFPFVLLGVERMRIVPHFTESTHFQLVYMPYTHSLLGSTLWAVGFGLVFAATHPRLRRRARIGIVMSVAVISHWLFDLLVHTPDLPLITDSSTKLGFGLWRNAPLTYALETVFLVGGLYLYMRATVPGRPSGLARWGVPGLVVFLLLLNIYNVFGPPPAGFMQVFLFAMGSYLGLAALASWLDRKRAASS
jgi:hypothetical protein